MRLATYKRQYNITSPNGETRDMNDHEQLLCNADPLSASWSNTVVNFGSGNAFVDEDIFDISTWSFQIATNRDDIASFISQYGEYTIGLIDGDVNVTRRCLIKEISRGEKKSKNGRIWSVTVTWVSPWYATTTAYSDKDYVKVFELATASTNPISNPDLNNPFMYHKIYGDKKIFYLATGWGGASTKTSYVHTFNSDNTVTVKAQSVTSSARNYLTVINNTLMRVFWSEGTTTDTYSEITIFNCETGSQFASYRGTGILDMPAIDITWGVCDVSFFGSDIYVRIISSYDPEEDTGTELTIRMRVGTQGFCIIDSISGVPAFTFATNTRDIDLFTTYNRYTMTNSDAKLNYGEADRAVNTYYRDSASMWVQYDTVSMYDMAVNSIDNSIVFTDRDTVNKLYQSDTSSGQTVKSIASVYTDGTLGIIHKRKYPPSSLTYNNMSVTYGSVRAVDFILDNGYEAIKDSGRKVDDGMIYLYPALDDAHSIAMDTTTNTLSTYQSTWSSQSTITLPLDANTINNATYNLNITPSASEQTITLTVNQITLSLTGIFNAGEDLIINAHVMNNSILYGDTDVRAYIDYTSTGYPYMTVGDNNVTAENAVIESVIVDITKEIV